MKIERKTIILPYSWLPTGTYHKNLAILILLLKINFGPFFHQKSFA
jgi:hypothetical protein